MHLGDTLLKPARRSIIKTGVVIGIIGAIAGIWLLTKKVGGGGNGGCLDLSAGVHYLTYTGASKTFEAALGECYAVIGTIDVWDDLYQDFIPPTDPMNDILVRFSFCKVVVHAPCRLCGFRI